ncbi:MAG: LLM class flavin-dependent oxidoreductase [Acidimicrobiales bacterium]
MAPLKVDVMLSNSVVGAARRAQELERTGVDGVFSFENAHDLFFPLVAAAPVCSLDLMTNVAIAFPRSPMHLANAAYDLHLLSEDRVRFGGLGSQIKAHVKRRFGARWYKPVPRCGSGSWPPRRSSTAGEGLAVQGRRQCRRSPPAGPSRQHAR